MAAADRREARPGDFMGQGLTPSGVWDSFFHGSEKGSGADASGGLPKIKFGLAGDETQLPDNSYLDTVPSATNTNSYVDATLKSQDGYFNQLGAPIARPRIDTASMTVPPLPNPTAITGGAANFNNYFDPAPFTLDVPNIPDMSLDMGQEL